MYKLFMGLIFSSGFIHSQTIADQLLQPLEKYQFFLEHGTLDHQDWSDFKTPPRSRYYTFKKAFEHFIEHQGKIVVELGTTRSFVHGGLPGCNTDDISWWTPSHPENWDWGAGFFTRVAAECLKLCKPEIHTVDISAVHLNRCKLITQEFRSILHYHCASSVDFLRNCHFPHGIDLLYLDTGDMTPIEPTALLQLEEAKIIVERDLLSKNGIILIDDVRNQTPKKCGDTSGLGKSKYALPYLLSHGYEIVEDEYQVTLRKIPTY